MGLNDRVRVKEHRRINKRGRIQRIREHYRPKPHQRC